MSLKEPPIINKNKVKNAKLQGGKRSTQKKGESWNGERKKGTRGQLGKKERGKYLKLHDRRGKDQPRGHRENEKITPKRGPTQNFKRKKWQGDRVRGDLRV